MPAAQPAPCRALPALDPAAAAATATAGAAGLATRGEPPRQPLGRGRQEGPRGLRAQRGPWAPSPGTGCAGGRPCKAGAERLPEMLAFGTRERLPLVLTVGFPIQTGRDGAPDSGEDRIAER